MHIPATHTKLTQNAHVYVNTHTDTSAAHTHTPSCTGSPPPRTPPPHLPAHPHPPTHPCVFPPSGVFQRRPWIAYGGAQPEQWQSVTQVAWEPIQGVVQHLTDRSLVDTTNRLVKETGVRMNQFCRTVANHVSLLLAFGHLCCSPFFALASFPHCSLQCFPLCVSFHSECLRVFFGMNEGLSQNVCLCDPSVPVDKSCAEGLKDQREGVGTHMHAPRGKPGGSTGG